MHCIAFGGMQCRQYGWATSRHRGRQAVVQKRGGGHNLGLRYWKQAICDMVSYEFVFDYMTYSYSGRRNEAFMRQDKELIQFYEYLVDCF